MLLVHPHEDPDQATWYHVDDLIAAGVPVPVPTGEPCALREVADSKTALMVPGRLGLYRYIGCYGNQSGAGGILRNIITDEEIKVDYKVMVTPAKLVPINERFCCV